MDARIGFSAGPVGRGDAGAVEPHGGRGDGGDPEPIDGGDAGDLARVDGGGGQEASGGSHTSNFR